MMGFHTVVMILSICMSVSAVPVGRFGPSLTQSVTLNTNVTYSSILSILLNDPALVDPLENEGITISQGELIEGDIIVPFGWHPREMPMAAASGSLDMGGPRLPGVSDPSLRGSAHVPFMVRIARPDKTWTDRVVPYVIGDGFNTTELNVIQLAIQEVMESSGSCITFVPRDHQDNFVFITGRLSGCNSYVGRQGGNQTVSISSADNCVTKGIVMHELMHVLGFLHEHTRYDRDAYIQIIVDNIIPGQESNFDINKEADLQNITYDYYSIMHYKTNQFSIHRATLNTIAIRDNTVNLEEVGQRRYLSDKDRTRIQTLYNCPLKGCSFPHTMNDGYIQVKNTSVGSSIRYSCTASNHVLIGAWERTCLYDGKWSGSTPICYDNNSVVSYCNFEDIAICGWTQDLTDEADWTRHNSRTPDENTGPMEDHTLQNSDGFYMYLDGSGINPNISARLISPEFQGMANGCLMFWYNMYGQGMGTLSVYLKSDGNILDKLWSISGNQGNSWKMQLISDINPTVPFQVIFEATRGRRVTTDIAIDDVILGDCQNILPYKDAVIRELKEEYHKCNFNTGFCGWYQWSNASLQWYRQSGSTPSLFTGPSCDCNNCSQCSNGSYVYIETSGSARRGDMALLVSPVFKETGFSCLHFEYHMYGRDIGNLSLYVSEYNTSTLVWSASGAKGDSWIPKQLQLFTNESFEIAFTATSGGTYQGDIAVDDVIMHTGVCPIVHACDFDQGNLCEFDNDKNTDDFDWIFGNHLSTQILTGPQSDHTTGNGSFLYIDASAPRVPGDKARLVSPPFLPTENCLTFWYYMYGRDVESLRILILNDNGTEVTLTEKHGDQGQTWYKTSLDIPPSTSKIQIVFEAEVGRSYASDIAIDDVQITNSKCQLNTEV